MKQILKNRKLWTALSVTMGSLLVVALSGKDIVTSQEASINHFLNIETFKTINQGDPEESQYFRATYTSKDALPPFSRIIESAFILIFTTAILAIISSIS